MARLIRHEETGPIEVKPQEKSAWICACGLTQDGPYCDGSHSKARKEEDGKLYIYNNDATEIAEERDDV
jgi:CDGSH-type Zn-finger protein